MELLLRSAWKVGRCPYFEKQNQADDEVEIKKTEPESDSGVNPVGK